MAGSKGWRVLVRFARPIAATDEADLEAALAILDAEEITRARRYRFDRRDEHQIEKRAKHDLRGTFK